MPKLNTRIQLKRDTTEHWDNAIGFIPLPGEVIVYTDFDEIEYTDETGTIKTKQIPNIKVGTGNAYVQDLAFVDDKTRDLLLQHIYDLDLHTTINEKLFWNNKLNVDDAEEQITGELEEETLILNRN